MCLVSSVFSVFSVCYVCHYHYLFQRKAAFSRRMIMPVSRVLLVALLGLGYWGTFTVEGIEIFMYIRSVAPALGQLRRRLSLQV